MLAAASHISVGFVLALVLKMVIAGAIAVSITVVAERVGPLVGGLLATLPVLSGPAYLFLALDHNSTFISQTALSTFAENIPAAIFATSYCILAQRLSTVVSIATSLVVWAIYLVLSLYWDRTLPTALLLGACVFPLCILIVQPYLHATAPAGRPHVLDMVIRGLVVGLLVGAIEVLSLVASARWTGVLTAAPVFYVCLMVIMQQRLGGPAAAALIANTLAGFTGTSLAFMAVHLLALPLGKWEALACGLAFSILWNTGLFVLHRYGAQLARCAVAAAAGRQNLMMRPSGEA